MKNVVVQCSGHIRNKARGGEASQDNDRNKMIDLILKNVICFLAALMQKVNRFRFPFPFVFQPLRYAIEILIIGILKLWILYLNARYGYGLKLDVIKRKLGQGQGQDFGEIGKR